MNAVLFQMMEGQQIGPYHLEKLLGAGGFGGVFRANEVVRDRVVRQVALKLIPGNDDQQLEELLAAAILEHDHLIRCYAPGEGRVLNIEALYLAMELAEDSLDRHLQAQPLATAEIRGIIGEIAAGLAYLHGQRQAHRDLKPANVLRAKGRWKLSDFGLARRLGMESYAQTANPIGTIAYMPPEAFEGKISTAWDMWSLGIMAAQMVGADLPYRFSEPTQLLKQVMDAALVLPLLPEELRPIVEGCLQVDRHSRWTAAQVLDALKPPAPVIQIPSPPALNLEIITEDLGNGVTMESEFSNMPFQFSQMMQSQGCVVLGSNTHKSLWQLAVRPQSIDDQNVILNLTISVALDENWSIVGFEDETNRKGFYNAQSNIQFPLDCFSDDIIEAFKRNITKLAEDKLLGTPYAEQPKMWVLGFTNPSQIAFCLHGAVGKNGVVKGIITQIDLDFSSVLLTGSGIGFIRENLGNEVILELVQLPAGQFMMGSPDNEPDTYDWEKPEHLVAVKAFAMGKYPITQAQYEAVMGKNPSYFSGNPNNPVERVTWNEAKEFCKKLSQATGKNYRLPSEAEWEYACRAGTTSRYYFGDNADQLENYAWFGDNSGTQKINALALWWEEDSNQLLERLLANKCQTQPVGKKKPNAWGLYDMNGNVWEWCEDTWHDNYQEAPTDGSAWIDNHSRIGVARGGSWDFIPGSCRSASRFYNSRDGRIFIFGFRVLCEGSLLE